MFRMWFLVIRTRSTAELDCRWRAIVYSKGDGTLSIRSDFALLSGGAGVSLIEANFQTNIGQRRRHLVLNSLICQQLLASQSAAFAQLGALDAPLSGAIRGGFDQKARADHCNT